ncbi:MAG: hypothetical protein QM770_22440 [Tepidisphaeraceae bacterium]
MNAYELGKQLVDLVNAGKSREAMNKFYADDIVSVEAMSKPGGSAESRGLAAVNAKADWWEANHIIHSGEAVGPFPHGDDCFAVIFRYDVTSKELNQRFKLEEVGVYDVKNDKVVRERFFYHMGM